MCNLYQFKYQEIVCLPAYFTHSFTWLHVIASICTCYSFFFVSLNNLRLKSMLKSSHSLSLSGTNVHTFNNFFLFLYHNIALRYAHEHKKKCVCEKLEERNFFFFEDLWSFYCHHTFSCHKPAYSLCRANVFYINDWSTRLTKCSSAAQFTWLIFYCHLWREYCTLLYNI